LLIAGCSVTRRHRHENQRHERLDRRPRHKALRFYTDVLGFVKKTEIPLGEARWLTVVSPEEPEGTELLLEPDGHPAAKPFKLALVEDGIPFTSFAVDDVRDESDFAVSVSGSPRSRSRRAR
jgi:catechol 2,3-dioxygenase-like lactoylglutathione lyase family enzyme